MMQLNGALFYLSNSDSGLSLLLALDTRHTPVSGCSVNRVVALVDGLVCFVSAPAV